MSPTWKYLKQTWNHWRGSWLGIHRKIPYIISDSLKKRAIPSYKDVFKQSFCSLLFPPGRSRKPCSPLKGPSMGRTKRPRPWKRLKSWLWSLPGKPKSRPCSGPFAWPLVPTFSSPASTRSSRTFLCLLGLKFSGEKASWSGCWALNSDENALYHNLK